MKKFGLTMVREIILYNRRYGTSKYPGVCWNRSRKYWQAQIVIEGKQKYLGYYKTEKDAFYAYCQEHIIHVGPLPIQVTRYFDKLTEGE